MAKIREHKQKWSFTIKNTYLWNTLYKSKYQENSNKEFCTEYSPLCGQEQGTGTKTRRTTTEREQDIQKGKKKNRRIWKPMMKEIAENSLDGKNLNRRGSPKNERVENN